MRLFWKSIAAFLLILTWSDEVKAVPVDFLKTDVCDAVCADTADKAIQKAVRQWIKECNAALSDIAEKDEEQIIRPLLDMNNMPLAELRNSNIAEKIRDLAEPVLERWAFAKNELTVSDKTMLAMLGSLCLVPDMEEGWVFLRLDYSSFYRHVRFSPEGRAFADVLVSQPLCNEDLGGEEYFMIWSQLHIADWAVQWENFLRSNAENPYAPDAAIRFQTMIDLMLFQALPPRDQNGVMYDRWNWWKKEMLGTIAKQYRNTLTGRLAEEFTIRVDANDGKVPKDLKQCFIAAVNAEFKTGKNESATLPTNNAQILYYEGTGGINGSIPVSVWFDIKDGLVFGEIVYTRTKNKTPIRLLGKKEEDGSCLLYEMLPNGDISGTIAGTLANGVLSGTWYGRPQKIEKSEGNYEVRNGKKFPVKISAAERTHAPHNWEFDAKKASGTYAYSLGDNCDDGTLFLQINNDGTVSYRLIGLTGAPFYRTACFPENALSGETAITKLLGNKILIEEDEKCSIEILLYNDFLVSRYVDGKDCQHRVGNGATAEGLFTKKR